MTISDEDLARELRKARNMTGSWADMGEPIRFAWFAVAAKARELLTPDMQMPPFPGSLGPLQPGDVVNVRGVVKEAFKDGSALVMMPHDHRVPCPAHQVTLIERPTPPEPSWQPGDVAQDERGTLYRYWPHDGDMFAPWLSIHGNRDIERWVTRAQIPGTLTPCDVVPREAK